MPQKFVWSFSTSAMFALCKGGAAAKIFFELARIICRCLPRPFVILFAGVVLRGKNYLDLCNGFVSSY